VVDPTGAALDAFLASLDLDMYYVDPDTARDALRRRSQRDVIDMTTGWKADLIIRKIGRLVSRSSRAGSP